MEGSRSAPFFGCLESVRGIAAFSVAIYHCTTPIRIDGETVWAKSFWELHGLDAIALRSIIALFSGSAAVSMFFVLSGMVLQISLRKTQPLGVFEAWGFFVKRFFRIYPPLFINILFMAAVLWLIYATIMPKGSFPPSVRDVLDNLLLRHFVVNDPSWTLAIEIAAVPCILIAHCASRILGAKALWSLTIGAIAISFLCTYSNGFFDFAFEFFLGMLVAELGTLRWVRPFGCLIAFFVICLARPVIGIASNTMVHWTVLLEGLGSGYIISGLAFGDAFWLHRVLDMRPLRALGKRSYSFYLFNPIALFVTLQAILVPLELSSKLPPLMFAGLCSTFSVVLTLPLCFLSFRWVEQPAIAIGNRLACLRLFNSRPYPFNRRVL
jgi:peptidoglycan/LPS O-acetylase OafA/YrhL